MLLAIVLSFVTEKNKLEMLVRRSRQQINRLRNTSILSSRPPCLNATSCCHI